MSKVAVCYRPEDSRDVAARLCDRLTEEFGAARVVRGTTLLEPISGSDVVVVIIGQGWLTPVDADGQHESMTRRTTSEFRSKGGWRPVRWSSRRC